MGSRNLVSFQIQELVRRHIVRQNVVPMRLQHGREHDAVKHDVVFPYEMNQASVLTLPPLFPRLRQKLLSIGNIPDWRIEPDIQHLSLCPINRQRDAPVQVTAHRTRLQATIQPRFALTVNVCLPLLVLFQNPIAEPWLIFIQRHVPVLCLDLDWSRPAELRLRIYQFLRTQSAATLLALIPIRIRIATLRASPDDVSVSKKHFRLRVKELFRLLRDEFVVIVQLLEEIRSILLMHLGSGSGINVEINSQPGE